MSKNLPHPIHAIFDIDGCLSDDHWRRHLLPVHQPEGHPELTDEHYLPYNLRCGEDAVFAESVDLVLLNVSAEREIVFCTARPELFRADTEAWIERNLPLEAADYTLLMRPAGNLQRSPDLKLSLLNAFAQDSSFAGIPLPFDCMVAYDDRKDVVEAYRAAGISAQVLAPEGRKRVSNEEKAALVSPPTRPRNAADILQDAANTFRERNAVYKDNYKQVAQLVKVLFPAGVPPELVVRDQWHLFELMLVKLSRFAISGLQHQDSIRDTAVYAAMIEAIIEEQQ